MLTESPMILDVPEEEKKPLDREAVILTVPEYEEDIYNYLRQAEVRIIALSNYHYNLYVFRVILLFHGFVNCDVGTFEFSSVNLASTFERSLGSFAESCIKH